MKKMTSILALLLLGGFVLAGCGESGNADSGNLAQPSNNSGGNSGGDSGNNNSGGGSQGGQQGGEGSGQGQQQGGEGSGSGGQQSGGEGSGGGSGEGGSGSGEGGSGGGSGEGGSGEGGSGEINVNSRFVDKKFVVQTVQATDSAVQVGLQTAFANAYASLFSGGEFQLIIPGEYLLATLGRFTVNDADTVATLTVRAEYDGEEEDYYYPQTTISYQITYDAENNNYLLPMDRTPGGASISYTVVLVPSAQAPEAADLPNNPNGDSFNPQYQVYKYRWDEIFQENDIILDNFTVQSGGWVYEVNNGLIRAYGEGYPNNDLYYLRKSAIEGGYKYDVWTAYDGEGSYTFSEDVELESDHFDVLMGIFKIAFSKASFNEYLHYYSCGSVRYVSNLNVTFNVSNYRVYFVEGKVSKITYTDRGDNVEINFTNIGSTTVTLPSGGSSTTYPASQIEEYLTGTTDSFPDLSLPGATYTFHEPTGIVVCCSVEYEISGDADIDSLVESLGRYLVTTYDYCLKYSVEDEVSLYVSENNQIGIRARKVSGTSLALDIYNFVINTTTFKVDYEAFSDDDWDMLQYDPVFFVWAWYENSTGFWTPVTVTLNNADTPDDDSDDFYYFTVRLPDEVIGMKLVRFNPNASTKPTNGQTTWGTYGDGDIWSESASMTLSSFLPRNVTLAR